MNYMRRGIAWLNAQRNEHAAQDAQYHHGDLILEISATKGRTVFEGADDYGAQVSAQAWDFLILDADLNLKPEPGDVIVYDGRRYELMAFDGAVLQAAHAAFYEEWIDFFLRLGRSERVRAIQKVRAALAMRSRSLCSVHDSGLDRVGAAESRESIVRGDSPLIEAGIRAAEKRVDQVDVDRIVDKILEVDPNETILSSLTGGEKSTNSPVRLESSPTD